MPEESDDFDSPWISLAARQAAIATLDRLQKSEEIRNGLNRLNVDPGEIPILYHGCSRFQEALEAENENDRERAREEFLVGIRNFQRSLSEFERSTKSYVSLDGEIRVATLVRTGRYLASLRMRGTEPRPRLELSELLLGLISHVTHSGEFSVPDLIRERLLTPTGQFPRTPNAAAINYTIRTMQASGIDTNGTGFNATAALVASTLIDGDIDELAVAQAKAQLLKSDRRRRKT